MADTGSQIAKAYVQVIPSARGMKDALSGVFGSEGSNAGNTFGGNLISTIKNIVLAAGLGNLIQEALTEGADKQQSLGGIETLFKDSADIVIANAERAYKTAGMSANSYMEMVTGFSASLLQGLGGDTQTAAEVADMALTDMADNANKMGTSMELIQNAYQGFAKQNYTMLDNLKLGYGGTKTEMERLLADAQKLTGIEYDIDNLADVYSAIHVIQEELNISGLSAEEAAEMVAAGLMTEEEAFEAMGTTAKEASTTFSGSMASMKAAASDLMASLTLGEDITPKLEALTEMVFTFVGGNLLPMVGNLLSGLPAVLRQGLTMAADALKLTSENADAIVSSGVDFVIELCTGIMEGLPYLAEATVELVGALGQALFEFDWETTLTDLMISIQNCLGLTAGAVLGTDGSIIEAVASGVTENLPGLLNEGVAIVTEVANGLLSGLPGAISAAGEILGGILGFLADNLPSVLSAGVDLVLNLVSGIIDSLPEIASSALDVCMEFLGCIGENLPGFLESGITLVCELAAGLIEAIPDLLEAVGEILADLWDAIVNYDWLQLGKDVLTGIADGLIEGVQIVIDAAWSVGEAILNGAKDVLDIHSPSRRFRVEVGAQIPSGIALGVEDNADVVKASMDELANYATDSFSTDFEVSGTMRGITPMGGFVGSLGGNDLEEFLGDCQHATELRLDRLIMLLEMILEAVLSIDLDGEMLVRVLKSTQKSMAIAKGG
jgi:phage-related protein